MFRAGLIFRDDLMALMTDGVQIWDGVANIQIRRAFPGEAKWRTSRAKAIGHGNMEDADDMDRLPRRAPSIPHMRVYYDPSSSLCLKARTVQTSLSDRHLPVNR